MATILAGTLLVGGAVGAAAIGTATIGGALFYKYKKMEKRKLSKKATAGLFGGVLDTINPKYINDKTGIPYVIDDIFTQIESSGMNTQSIFHATGDINRIKQLKLLYEEGNLNEIELHTEHTHDLCGLVIHYLQQLPEPLCTLVLYSDFIKVHENNHENKENWITEMKKLFDLLPELNRRLFARILNFFNNVGENSNNNVSHSYLAYLLGPLLFYDRIDGEEEDGESSYLQYDSDLIYDMLMQLFFSNKELFPIPLLDLPPWRDTQEEDIKKRESTKLNMLSSMEELDCNSEHKEETTEEEQNIEIEEIEDIFQKKERKKKNKKNIFSTTINKFKPKFKPSLESQPPQNTVSVNYGPPPDLSQYSMLNESL